jgi:hypothetical protein
MHTPERTTSQLLGFESFKDVSLDSKKGNKLLPDNKN